MSTTLIGYHSTKKENKESILKEGFKSSMSCDDIMNDNGLEWLGDGVYFWEDEYYAVNWSDIKIKKNKKKGINEDINDYIIFKSTINTYESKIMDFSKYEGKKIYEMFKSNLISKYNKIGKNDIIDRLNKRSSKFWVNLLEDNGFFDEFDVVIAIFKSTKKETKRLDDMVFNMQKQICVKNKNCIKKTELYEDNERIDSLYKIILEKEC